jgi:hypothetical protein
MIPSPFRSRRPIQAYALRSFAAVALLVAAPAGHAGAEPGQPAPGFSLRNLAGEGVDLARFKGKTVVLEWNNPNCPYVRKHYGSGNMQGLQAARGDVVWLAVNSTNPSSGDFMDAAALKQWLAQMKSVPTHYLLDPEGTVGRLYGARTTPHMYIVDAQGRVVYAGAIDDKRSTDPADIPGASNYVKAALAAMAKGQPVANASTKPYGCSIKY